VAIVAVYVLLGLIASFGAEGKLVTVGVELGLVWMQVPAGTVGTLADAGDDPVEVEAAVELLPELLPELLEPQAVNAIRPPVTRTAAMLR
jgi:hypothetical protein